MRLARTLFDFTLLIVAAFLITFLALGCSASRVSAPLDNEQDEDNESGVGPVSGELEYQFGAKFEPPIGRVVHAQGQWQVYNAKYAALLPASAQPASGLMFIAIADTVRPWNPQQIAAQMNVLAAAGRVPHLDISLRGNQPTPAELAQMPDPLYGVDDEIAYTNKYDSRLTDLVNIAKQHKRPVMLRIGGEFSGWWNGYHPFDYPKAFRKIVHMFRTAGADNVAFIWCYEPAAANDFDAMNAQGEYKWFPGADVIDWFSVDLFAQQDVSGSQAGHGGVATSFAKTLRFLDMAVANQRPVVIAESSPSHYDFASAVDGAAVWNEWFSPYFALIESRPEIKWFHYINYDWGQASYYAASGWKNNDLTANASLAQLYVGEVTRPKYLHAHETQLLKDFGKYK